MMKTKISDRQDPKNPLSARKMNPEPVAALTQHHQEPSNSELDGLLSRLASGQKASVDIKSMKRLTNKNYEKLPEIQKKKEEAKKQEDLKA